MSWYHSILCVSFYALSCFQTNHPQSGFLWILVTEAGIRTLFVVPGIVFNKLVFVGRTAKILNINFESMEQDLTLNWTQSDHHTPNFTFTGGKGTLW